MECLSCPSADRTWMPSYSIWSDSTWALSEPETKAKFEELQVGFPHHTRSPIVWSSSSFQADDAYVFELESRYISEIEAAGAYFKTLNAPLSSISSSSFPLPVLGPILRDLARAIHDGQGFHLLRGLNPKKYSAEMNCILYIGVSSYIGEVRGRQDEHGNMLIHLTDMGSIVAPDNERQAPYSNVSQPFHTDTGHVVALYALGQAYVGGESKLASSSKIYNDIVKMRPDLVGVLAESSWTFDRFGRQPPYDIRPILFHEDQKIIFAFARRPLLGSPTSPRTEGIPDLTERQIEALNLVHFLAEKHAIQIKMQRGDMLFWNNMGLLHCRTGFTDSVCHKRHLVRLWLHNEERAWKVPVALRPDWEYTFSNAGREEQWPLEPIVDRKYVSLQQRSCGHG
ncbi:MAG: hypothetical protein M1833_005256 [Piccolia ochrophora]|nr:MAG: hypothetical protein M1833_005256 [Piccolia ochrophora]